MTSDKKPDPKIWAKYSGMALQMGVTIALGVWGGMKLDEIYPMGRFPVFTITLSLLSVFGAMYWAIKDLLKK